MLTLELLGDLFAGVFGSGESLTLAVSVDEDEYLFDSTIFLLLP